MRDVADEQLVGNRLLQQPIHVPQVPPEQIVELQVVRRRMVVAVPPEPVAAFGDQHLFARPRDGGGVHAGGRVQRLARVGQLAPRALIVGVAESRCRSSRRSTTRERCPAAPARVPARLPHRDGPELGVRGQAAIERAQERAAAAFEVLPGVLAVEDDRDERLSPAGAVAVAPAGLDEPRHEVVGRRFGRPAGVGEADEIRQHVIAERARDPRAAGPHAGRRVEALGLLDVSVAVARERHAERARENQLVGRHPREARRGDERHHRVRHGAFRRPQPHRPAAEQPLVARGRRARAARRRPPDATKRWRGRRAVGMRPQIDVRVAEQRQNRVIEGRRRQLDLPSRRGVAVFGDHLVQQLELDLVAAAPCRPR